VNDKSFLTKEQNLSNLQKNLIYSFFQLHIDQCEKFDVKVELINIMLLLIPRM